MDTNNDKAKNARVYRRKEELDRELGPAPIGSGSVRWMRANFEVEAEMRAEAAREAQTPKVVLTVEYRSQSRGWVPVTTVRVFDTAEVRRNWNSAVSILVVEVSTTKPA